MVIVNMYRDICIELLFALMITAYISLTTQRIKSENCHVKLPKFKPAVTIEENTMKFRKYKGMIVA